MRRFLNCVFLVGVLTGCSTIGSLNPFGQSERGLPIVRGEGGDITIVEREINDGSELVPSISDSRLDRERKGAILVVEAILPIQGYYDGRLYRRNFGEPDENGILFYEFRAKAPPAGTSTGPQITRIVQAADFITTGELRDVVEIRIKTASGIVRLRP